jgi:hypothetical protein
MGHSCPGRLAIKLYWWQIIMVPGNLARLSLSPAAESRVTSQGIVRRMDQRRGQLLHRALTCQYTWAPLQYLS